MGALARCAEYSEDAVVVEQPHPQSQAAAAAAEEVRTSVEGS